MKKTLLLIIILLIITRIGYWNLIVVEGQWDEITYLIAGREILKGKIPYIDFYEIKTVFSLQRKLYSILLQKRHKDVMEDLQLASKIHWTKG